MAVHHSVQLPHQPAAQGVSGTPISHASVSARIALCGRTSAGTGIKLQWDPVDIR